MPFMLLLNGYKENDVFFDTQLIRTLLGEHTPRTDLLATAAMIILAVSALPRVFAALALMRELWFKQCYQGVRGFAHMEQTDREEHLDYMASMYFMAE